LGRPRSSRKKGTGLRVRLDAGALHQYPTVLIGSDGGTVPRQWTREPCRTPLEACRSEAAGGRREAPISTPTIGLQRVGAPSKTHRLRTAARIVFRTQTSNPPASDHAASGVRHGSRARDLDHALLPSKSGPSLICHIRSSPRPDPAPAHARSRAEMTLESKTALAHTGEGTWAPGLPSFVTPR
jgi:hypothetical protein